MLQNVYDIVSLTNKCYEDRLYAYNIIMKEYDFTQKIMCAELAILTKACYLDAEKLNLIYNFICKDAILDPENRRVLHKTIWTGDDVIIALFKHKYGTHWTDYLAKGVVYNAINAVAIGWFAYFTAFLIIKGIMAS